MEVMNIISCYNQLYENYMNVESVPKLIHSIYTNYIVCFNKYMITLI